MNADRHATGLALLARLSGSPRPAIVEALADVAPALAGFAVDFAYGEVLAGDALDLPRRQLATVAMLAALGGLEPQLEFHLAGALEVGRDPRELVELMTHLAVYAGFPAALNGVFAARRVFARRGIAVDTTPAPPVADRRAEGVAGLRRVDGVHGERVLDGLADIAPDLGRHVVEFVFGEIYARPGLALLERELGTVAALVALGNAMPQLRVHMHAFLNVGGTPAQLVGVVTQAAVYAGFPRAIGAALLAQEVLAERADPTLSGAR